MRNIIRIKREESIELLEKDVNILKLVSIIGDIEIELRQNYFVSLVQSIIGQQISIHSSQSIFNKLMALHSEVSPAKILDSSFDELKEIGLSRQKISYIKDLSEKCTNNTIFFNNIHSLSNEEIIELLTKVKGIGRWTAEMFLIFSMGRLNVLSLDDVGLQRACKWLYNKNSHGKELLRLNSNNWKQMYTIPSLYLWEAVNRGFVVKYSSVDEMIKQFEI